MDSLTTDLHRALVAADPRLSKFRPLPRILSFDEFNTGLHGWCELIGNYDGDGNLDLVDAHMRDFRPPQLSSCTFFDIGTHGSMSGNYALKVATRPIAGHTAVAIKRLTMAERGRVQFETYFTYKAEAASDPAQSGNDYGNVVWDGNVHPSEAHFGAITVANDICDPEGIRYHCVMRYQNTDLDNRLVRRWLYPTVPEPTPRDSLRNKSQFSYTDDFTAPNPEDWSVLGDASQNLCYNEVPTKVNWHYLRWQFDTRLRRNIELQVNDRVMDIRHVPVPHYPDRYEALENLLNFYVSVRTHAPIRNFLYLDSALISVDW